MTLSCKSALRGSIVAAALAMVAAPRGAAQGETGFLRGAGNYDVIPYYNVDRYDEFWVGSTDVDNDAAGFGEIERTTYGLFGAYGVSDDVDVSLNIAYVGSTAEAGVESERDFQDATLRGKWRILGARKEERPLQLSVLLAPGIKFPLSDYEDNSITSIGDGQTDYLGRVIGHVWLKSGLFASLETGYDYRAGRPDDEIPIHLTVGGTLFRRFTVSPFYSNINSLDGIDLGQGPFTEAEEDLERLGVSVFVRLTDKIGVTGNYKVTLDGKNTGDVDGFSLGLVVRFAPPPVKN